MEVGQPRWPGSIEDEGRIQEWAGKLGRFDWFICFGGWCMSTLAGPALVRVYREARGGNPGPLPDGADVYFEFMLLTPDQS